MLNIDRLARNVGGSSHKDYDCLEWPYEPDSVIRKLFIDVYRELFDEEVIAKNMGRKVDMISIGPEIRRFKP